jgi:hypothetical protein
MTARLMLVIVGFTVSLLLLADLVPYVSGSNLDPGGLVGVKATYTCPPREVWFSDIRVAENVYMYAGVPSIAFFYKYPRVLANITMAVEQLDRRIDITEAVERIKEQRSVPSDLEVRLRESLREAVHYARELKRVDFSDERFDFALRSLRIALWELQQWGVIVFNTSLWWHVIGFDNGFYTIVLGVNVTLSSSSKVIGYGVVEEVVQVSALDRTMYYKGEYAGRWPFFLMPHELYEGSKVDILDTILYRRLKGVEIREVQEALAELSREWVKFFTDMIPGYTEYLKGTLRIPVERLLEARLQVILPADRAPMLASELLNATYSLLDELTGRKLPRAITWFRTTGFIISIQAIYDIGTGVAVSIRSMPMSVNTDPLDYVIPLSSYYPASGGCIWFVLVDLRREEARITTTPTTAMTVTPKPPEATPTITAPVETQVTQTTTPIEVGRTTTSPPETPTTPPGITTRTPGTPATPPAPPIPAISPGLPMQTVDGRTRGQEGLIAVELLTVALAALSLTIVAAIAYRILVRQK